MKFKEFKIKDIFNVTGSKCIFHANNTPVIDKWEDGYRRYIVRSEYKNGLKGYIKEDFDYLNPPYTISFAQDTFIAFTQTKSYFTGNNVKILHPLKEDINTHHLLYLETAINKTVKEYSWGMGSTKKEINNYKIFLPTSDDVNPDWDYMENYIKNMQNKYKEQLKKKNDQWIKDACKIVGLDAEEILNPKEKDKTAVKTPELKYDTGEFKIGDFFDIHSIVGINIDKLTPISKEHNYPYITRTSYNNGIHSHTGLIPNIELQKENTFSIGLLNMDFFYQNNKWYAGQFVRSVVPVCTLTSMQALFFKTLFDKLKPVLKSVLIRDFDDLFLNTKITLPIDKEGNPDFDMMSKITHTHIKKFVKNKQILNERKLDIMNKLVNN